MHDWQKEFVLKKDLVELDIENLERHLLKMPRIALENTRMASKLKAAIEAGWVEEPPTEVGEFESKPRYFYKEQNVDDMHAGAVRWLGDMVDKAYQSATEIPKNL